MTNEAILKKIEEMESEIKKGVEIRVEANTNIKMLRKQYEEKNNELKALGIDPKKEQQELSKMDEEIENLIKEIEGKIPSDLIKNYTATMPSNEQAESSGFDSNLADSEF